MDAALQLRLPGHVWKCQADLGAPLNLQQPFSGRAGAAEKQEGGDALNAHGGEGDKSILDTKFSFKYQV